MLSDKRIEEAKAKTRYSDDDIAHEHNDCIRIAYEWLSAQQRTKTPCGRTYAIKHIIESWGGRYVSSSDVEVAAQMLNLPGQYPHYHFSARLTEPDAIRLNGIEEAGKHMNYRETRRPDVYKRRERLDDI